MGSGLQVGGSVTLPSRTIAIMRTAVLAACVVVALVAVGCAQGRSVHQKAAKHSKAFPTAEALKMLMEHARAEARQATTVPPAADPTTSISPEVVEAIDALEVTTCGDNGLEGVILAAFQQFPELPEHTDCPAYDDYIWTLVVSDPFALCLMEPAHLRVGVECIRRYMEESPVPALYLMDGGVIQYLNNTEEKQEKIFNFSWLPGMWGKSATEEEQEKIFNFSWLPGMWGKSATEEEQEKIFISGAIAAASLA